MTTLVPVILAGGAGTRLWPVSRELLPKQMADLLGGDTLVQRTAKRVLRLSAPEHVMVIGSAQQSGLLRQQLRAISDHLTQHIVLEPFGRNTAPAVALAALHAQRLFGDDCLLYICPSDHLIGDEAALDTAVKHGMAAAAREQLVTFGITPSRPETGYGYIHAQPDGHNGPVWRVEAFVEKPPLAEAERMLQAGDYLWNSGMFLFRADTMLGELRAFAPDLLEACAATLAASVPDGSLTLDAERFAAVPAAPIDKAVMEKSARVAVVPVDPHWSDLGSWQALWEVSAKDEAGNVSAGDVVLSGAEGCYVRGDRRLLVAAGVRDLAIIDTDDALLVTDRRNSDALKDAVGSLKAASRAETVAPSAETRPWGSFRVLHEGNGFKVKEIIVKPGGRLSLQSHRHRAEHWTVVVGKARITVDDKIVDCGANETVHIPLGAVHRMENPFEGPMHLIEVQCGDYLGEDDIIRYEDAYGRG